MAEFLSGLGTLELVFFWSAVVGGALFLTRMIVQLLGGADFEAGSDVELGASPEIGSSDTSFQLLSMEGITSFLMMFGLVGLALKKSSGVGDELAIGGGLLAGVAAMFIIGRIFRAMFGLQSSGNLDLGNAVGQEAVVYLSVDPKDGGKVELTLQNRHQIMEAVTRGGETLQTGTRVRVVEVAGASLVVEKIAVGETEKAS